jgi:hypothetical protein
MLFVGELAEHKAIGNCRSLDRSFENPLIPRMVFDPKEQPYPTLPYPDLLLRQLSCIPVVISEARIHDRSLSPRASP